MTSGTSRPNFSGIWELNPKASSLRSSAPRNLVVSIDHREPHLMEEVVFVDATGVERRQVFKCEIGAESVNSVEGNTLRTRARWNGAELVLESWTKGPDRESHFQDHWSLSRDGQRLTMAHRNDDLAGQISVLEKCSNLNSGTGE